MIRFLDIDTKHIYCGDPPYVIYIGQGCSTGKWYSKTLLVISDVKTQSLEARLEDENGCFHLITTKNSIGDIGANTEINGHNYADLSGMLSSSQFSSFQNTVRMHDSRGRLLDGYFFVYQFNVLFMSDSEGEFHDVLRLILHGSIKNGENEEDTETELGVYELAADAYMEDERLSIDLANEGIEIPDSFQRAVYPSNVRDESSDNILLNRKWKELLIEYWNTIANKGSYKSLVNSLKFFEFGDIVHIEEYWKQKDNFGIEEMVGRDIEQILDPLIREYLDVMSKTTYIGLYLSSNSTYKNDKGEFDYVDQFDYDPEDSNYFIAEPIPELQEAALMHTVEDLRLKMVLLANYFSTYFMPIHLDLIHSTVDRLVFTNTVKILHGVRFRREDWFDSVSPISCNLSIDKDFWMGNVRAFNYPDTVLRQDNTPSFWGDLDMVGMDPDIRDYGHGQSVPTSPDSFATGGMNQEQTEKFLNQYFGGVGCLVPVRTKISKVRNFIENTRISIYRKIEDSNYSLVTTYLWEHEIRDDEMQFNLVFTRSGEYCVMVQMTRVDGSDFAGSWYINVHGSVGNLVSIKKFKKIDYREDKDEFDDWFYNNLDFNNFMFTEPFENQIVYKQWLVPTGGLDSNGLGLNHILVYDCGNGSRPVKLSYRGQDVEFFYSDILVEQLSALYPHYWWKTMERVVGMRDSEGDLTSSGEKRRYLIGVRKYFDTDEYNVRLFEKRYNEYGTTGELEDSHVIIVDYTGSTSKIARGFLTVTCPVGSTVWMDNGGRTVTSDDTVTIPVKKESSTLHIRYKIANHLFVADVDVQDMFSLYGLDEYKVHPSEDARETGYTTIDTSRFFPIFHRLEDIEGFTVGRDDTVVCLPNFRWVDGQVENCYWEFVNRTTGETIDSKSFKKTGDKLYIEQPFIGEYDYLGTLRKGYYDVTLHFEMGGHENTETVESAFRIA